MASAAHPRRDLRVRRRRSLAPLSIREVAVPALRPTALQGQGSVARPAREEGRTRCAVVSELIPVDCFATFIQDVSMDGHAPSRTCRPRALPSELLEAEGIRYAI